MASGRSEHVCLDCKPKFCPICGCELTYFTYRGKKSDLLALARSKGFRCFLGCIRMDLHDKVLTDRGQVYIIGAVFDSGFRPR